MSDALDMSLDDLIRKNKKHSNANFRGRGRGGGGGGRGFGPGAVRRLSNRFPTRMAPYIAPQAMQVQDAFGGGGHGDAKLYVSNLDYGVSNEDIKVLFSEVGELKRYSIHYDKSGRSKGTAEVVFVCKSGALAAMKRYNGVKLDGKPMKIELVGGSFAAPVALTPVTSGLNPSGNFRQQFAGSGWNRGRGGHGSGRSYGTGRDRGGKISPEDLDADLDKYHLEAMQIN